ncbi:uncharacterized protein LOC128133181 [Lactuca sativa]|uniref:uncharacterized protein LOC128133181 n=1 Tax=Lactuca sativa TaxID=4236 RepID=UPI0022AF70D6|nr:uncharacterized protein LOC128133181 [Lactuca sativa]
MAEKKETDFPLRVFTVALGFNDGGSSSPWRKPSNINGQKEDESLELMCCCRHATSSVGSRLYVYGGLREVGGGCRGNSGGSGRGGCGGRGSGGGGSGCVGSNSGKNSSSSGGGGGDE